MLFRYFAMFLDFWKLFLERLEAFPKNCSQISGLQPIHDHFYVDPIIEGEINWMNSKIRHRDLPSLFDYQL